MDYDKDPYLQKTSVLQNGANLRFHVNLGKGTCTSNLAGWLTLGGGTYLDSILLMPYSRGEYDLVRLGFHSIHE